MVRIGPGLELFAPNPLSLNSRTEAEITYRDGQTELWKFPRPQDFGYIKRYTMEREHKFSFDSLQNDKFVVLRPDAARYIARLNNTKTDNPPVTVTLVGYRSQIAPPGSGLPEPWKRRVLLHLFSAGRRLAMTFRRLFQAWNEFFFKPQSPIPVCLFRILYGILAFLNLIMLHGEWLKWYGVHSFVSLETMHRFGVGRHMSLFEIMPHTDLAVNILYWAFLVCTVFLMFGFMTRFSTFAVYLFLGSIQMRNEFILNSGDTLMLVTGFFLLFSPCGAALSVDHWLRVRRGRQALPSLFPAHGLSVCSRFRRRSSISRRSTGNRWASCGSMALRCITPCTCRIFNVSRSRSTICWCSNRSPG